MSALVSLRRKSLGKGGVKLKAVDFAVQGLKRFACKNISP
jgi:hypothetical protein